MNFHLNFEKQKEQILSNLDSCVATSQGERDEFRSVILDVLSSNPVSADCIVEIMKALERCAHNRNSYCKGVKSTPLSEARFHFSLQSKLERAIAYGLKNHPDFLFSETLAQDKAADILANLKHQSLVEHTISEFGEISIGRDERPFWITRETTGTLSPDANPSKLPARCGIQPAKRPLAYVLMKLTIEVEHEPRFADSNGYPYWRPGGKTLPIEGCPPEFSGLDEAVAKRVTIRRLAKQVEFFERKDH
jgi:hypothetical protein